MATKVPATESIGPGIRAASSMEAASKQPQSLLPAKTETPLTNSSTIFAAADPPPSIQPSSSSDATIIYVPSYSRWFSYENVHECEIRSLPEFFDSRSPSKNPRVYMYYRNSVVNQYRDNHPRKITFTEVRRTIVGDVGSIRRVFDFLESWGLINYTSSTPAKPLKWDDKEGKSSGDVSGESALLARETAKRICGGCKSVCTIACFSCEKYDLTLCARCYVRGNYRVGVNSTEFKRVEISEYTNAEWTEKETLQLMEAVMHYGDDWKKVSQQVSGRSEKDCVGQFLKLPFGEEYVNPTDSMEADEKSDQMKNPDGGESVPLSKRRCLTPLADLSNPIMAQAAFLSKLAGVDVAEAAARAAVEALSKVVNEGDIASQATNAKQEDGESMENKLESTSADAILMLEKEEQDLEKSISNIVEVKMKEMQDRIIHFEEMELQMEKERKQLEQMKNLLFADQMNIYFQKNTREPMKDRVRT